MTNAWLVRLLVAAFGTLFSSDAVSTEPAGTTTITIVAEKLTPPDKRERYASLYSFVVVSVGRQLVNDAECDEATDNNGRYACRLPCTAPSRPRTILILPPHPDTPPLPATFLEPDPASFVIEECKAVPTESTMQFKHQLYDQFHKGKVRIDLILKQDDALKR